MIETVIYILKHLAYCSNTLVYRCFDIVQRMGNLKYSEIHHRVHFYYSVYTFNVEHFTWLDNVKKILNECGFAYIWNTQTFVDPNWLRLTIIRNLQDQFEQYWLYRCFDIVQRMGNLKYSEIHHRVHFYYSVYTFCYFYWCYSIFELFISVHFFITYILSITCYCILYILYICISLLPCQIMMVY
jgi:hypothetical protein